MGGKIRPIFQTRRGIRKTKASGEAKAPSEAALALHFLQPGETKRHKAKAEEPDSQANNEAGFKILAGNQRQQVND